MIKGILFDVEDTSSGAKKIDDDYSYSVTTSNFADTIKIMYNKDNTIYKEFEIFDSIGNKCFMVVDDDNEFERFREAITVNPKFIKSIETAMYHLGFGPDARITDPNFNGDITEIPNTIVGRHVKRLVHVIIKKEDRIVLSFRYCLSWYFTMEEKLPWYATDEVEIKDVLLGAYFTKSLKGFRILKEPPIEKTNVICIQRS